MAHEAKLNIGNGQEYDIIDCEYKMEQPAGVAGITGKPRYGIIHFTMLSTDDNNMTFHRWMIDKMEQKSGSITFSSVRNAKMSTRTVVFKNAYCIKLHEHFNKYSGDMMMGITITGDIKFGNCEALQNGGSSGVLEEPERKAKVTDMYWTEEGSDEIHREIFPGYPVTLYLQAEDFVAGDTVEAVFSAEGDGLFAGNNKETSVTGTVDADGIAVIPDFRISYDKPKTEEK